MRLGRPQRMPPVHHIVLVAQRIHLVHAQPFAHQPRIEAGARHVQQMQIALLHVVNRALRERLTNAHIAIGRTDGHDFNFDAAIVLRIETEQIKLCAHEDHHVEDALEFLVPTNFWRNVLFDL